ncbi:Nitric oxide reductase transcription regulator NorR1 [compost metagenome]
MRLTSHEPMSLRQALDDFQRQTIEASLARHHGQWARAARELEIDPSNLHKLAKRLGMKA